MKRLLLVVDSHRWAWGHMARGIQKYAPAEYQVSVIDQNEFGVLTGELAWMLEAFDAVMQFSWVEASHQIPMKRSVTLLASHGAEYEFRGPVDLTQPDSDIPSSIATRLRNRRNARESLPKFAAVLCVSPALTEIAADCGANAVYCQPGVDHMQFLPLPFPCGDTLKVGWCGQSTGTTKGFTEVLLPLIERLKGEPIHFVVNSNTAQNAIEHKHMRRWYGALDVYLSTSCSEGSQTPPYEAAACGRPVLSTLAGTASALIDSANGTLLGEWRTPREATAVVARAANVLKRWCRQKADLARMGAAARRTIEDRFTWEKLAPEWCRAIAGD